MRVSIPDVLGNMKPRSVRKVFANQFPNLYSSLTTVPILQRVYVFSITKSKLNLFFWMYFVVTGKHISSKGFKLSNYGVWLATRPNDLTYTFCLDAKYGNRLEGLLHSISDKTVFVDIGANIGVFSLVAAQNPNISKIYSFEPDLESFEYFVRNIERNNSTRIIPHNHAISEYIGEATLSKTLGHSGASRIVSSESEISNTFTSISVVNHEFLNSVLGFTEQKYFVKIDVEGHEIEVLKTLKNAHFFRSITDFFVEFDNEFGRVSEVEKFLIENGFAEFSRWGKDSHWDSHWVRNAPKKTL